MPKTSDQKLKLIYLLRYFQECTDETHLVSMNQILEHLHSKGIQAERKSIYKDIETLNFLGYEILFTKEAPSGYYLGSRDFEIAELKLLVDAVQSSKFITEKKSTALIAKIEKLTSHYEGKQLQRQVYVANRVKTENESILYNVDYIHDAINDGKKIEFLYSEWNLEKKLVPRNQGKVYEVDPIMLMWDDENYYLVAYDGEADKVKHYRVDKMSGNQISSKSREFRDKYKNFNPAEYAKEHFAMYGGDSEITKVQFRDNLIGVVIDRFGKNVTIMKHGQNSFSARLKVQVSNQFFAWIASFAGDAKILEPQSVAEAYQDFLRKNIEAQKDI